MRTRTALIAAAAVLSFALPAHADEGVGALTEFGSITSSSEGLTIVPGAPQWVAGLCHYAGEATTSGTMQFQYGGEVLAGSTTTSPPQLVVITCTLTSPSLGLPGERPTLSSSFTVACPGAACAEATTVGPWPLRPVLICVDGYATFGLQRVDIVHACKSATL